MLMANACFLFLFEMIHLCSPESNSWNKLKGEKNCPFSPKNGNNFPGSLHIPFCEDTQLQPC